MNHLWQAPSFAPFRTEVLDNYPLGVVLRGNELESPAHRYEQGDYCNEACDNTYIEEHAVHAAQLSHAPSDNRGNGSKDGRPSEHESRRGGLCSSRNCVECCRQHHRVDRIQEHPQQG